jgi:hypothetical protein
MLKWDSLEKEDHSTGIVADDLIIKFYTTQLFMVMKTKILITILAFLALSTMVNAQSSSADRKNQSPVCRGIAFVDTNDNGICDHREDGTFAAQTGQRNRNFNGCGFCQNQGYRQYGNGKCCVNKRNFVDKNNNGICDLREKSVKK